jgi:hypothetical protein
VTDLAIAFLLGTELRAAKKGLKTLRKMLRREGGNLVKAALVAALVLAALVTIGVIR